MIDPELIQVYINKLSAAGWQCLLPMPRSQRVLCVDGLGGLTSLLLRDRYDEVVVVGVDSTLLQSAVACATQARMSGVTTWNLNDDPEQKTPSGGEARDFDGLVIHDPNGMLLRSGWLKKTDVLQRVIDRIRPGGFVYIAWPNRFSYKNLKNPSRWLRFFSIAGLNSWFGMYLWWRRLRHVGIKQKRLYPYLADESRMTEVLLSNGYHSNKNVHLSSERLRELLLGAVGAKWLAQGYCYVGIVGHGENESVLRDIALNEQLLGECVVEAKFCVPKHYIVLNLGKAIIGLGRRNAEDDSLIVIACSDPMSVGRRQRESAVLQRLYEVLPQFRAKIPHVLGAARIAGVDCFAITAIPGVTVDCDAPQLAEISNFAVEFLAQFHRATLQKIQLSAAIYADRIGVLFTDAKDRNPDLAPRLLDLEERLRDRILDQDIYGAWLHGDFKIENLIFDRRTHRLNGVIDWELSEEHGWPVLDLWYLIAYNRSMVSEQEVHDVFAEVFNDGALTPSEQKLFERYYAALPGIRDLGVVWQILCFVHHIGVRLHYPWPDAALAARLNAILDTLIQQLPQPRRLSVSLAG